jgi:hypothetical protein
MSGMPIDLQVDPRDPYRNFCEQLLVAGISLSEVWRRDLAGCPARGIPGAIHLQYNSRPWRAVV